MDESPHFYVRTYDTPGWLVLAMLCITLLACWVSYHTPPSMERLGYWLATAIAAAFSAFLVYRWIYGRPVRHDCVDPMIRDI